MTKRLNASFFERNALDIAPEILGKIIVRRLPDGTCLHTTITEVEVYLGEEDLACHACKGRTPNRDNVPYRWSRLCLFNLWHVLDAQFCYRH